MKFLFVLLMVMTAAHAQTSSEYLRLFDQKVYSLKTKGVKDFVVDISSPKLTQDLSEQKTFGNVKKLIFRAYWTANPERLAIEVIGLPEGFVEAKEQLKASILPVVENILPMTMEQRFPGYKIAPGKKAKTFMATDSTGVAPIPSYEIVFDSQDRLTQITGYPPLGSNQTEFIYEKKAFSDGKWVLSSVVTTTEQGGQTVTNSRKLSYGSSQGVGTLSSVTIETEIKGDAANQKPVSQSDVVHFENYQINSGAAFRYFLNDADKASP